MDKLIILEAWDVEKTHYEIQMKIYDKPVYGCRYHFAYTWKMEGGSSTTPIEPILLYSTLKAYSITPEVISEILRKAYTEINKL